MQAGVKTGTGQPAGRCNAVCACAVLFGLTFAVRMSLATVTMTDWDEWILTGISQRAGLELFPALQWNELISPTGYSYPPLFFWANGLVIGLLGPGMVVYRLLTAVTEALAVSLTAALGFQLGRDGITGWVAGLLASTSLWLAYHGTVTVDYMLACAVLAALVCAVRAADLSSARWLAAALLLGGFACFVKYHGVIFHAILCGGVLAWRPLREVLLSGPFLKTRARRAAVFAASALFFPIALLLIEAITWYEYGWERTHIAEVFRVMGWESFVVHPVSGAIVNPSWHYYLVHTATEVGPAVLALILAGAGVALWRREGRVCFLVAVVALWYLWASTASLMNARYVLPAVLIAMVFGGIAVRALWQMPRGRMVSLAILLLALGQGAWWSIARANTYATLGREADAMMAAVREHVPPDATLLVEAEWYEYAAQTGGLLPQRLIPPSRPDWLELPDAFLTHERAYEMRAVGMLYAEDSYRNQRDRLAEEWVLVFEIGEGPDRQRLLLRP